MTHIVGKPVRQVKRLLRNIYRPHHYYYIHVDEKSEYMYEQLKYLATFQNIKFFNTRYTSFWGSNTILYMLLRGIREILEMEWNFDYVMNISESDFPVRPIEEFENHLKERNGGNFIAMGKDQMLKFQEGNGLTKTFYNCDDHMYKVGERYALL